MANTACMVSTNSVVLDYHDITGLNITCSNTVFKLCALFVCLLVFNVPVTCNAAQRQKSGDNRAFCYAKTGMLNDLVTVY